MRQYEVAIRIAQVHHLADERKYRKALAVIQTLDMRQVRNVSDLKVFAEVYTRTEQLDAAKATYLRIYKKSRTRRILYRLIYLAIRTNDLEEAEKYYTEFVRMNPSDRDALILRYRIDKAAGVQISQLIDTLKALKEEEYIEEWAYELAKLYQQAGRYEECQEECEDIKLWFGTGEIVERAKLLLDHIQEKAPMPFLDDKDYTDLISKEEPNPDDTGSLPDLSEYLQSSSEQEMKLLKKADPAKFEALKSEKIATEETVEQAPVSDNLDTDVEESITEKEKPGALSNLSELLFGNKSEKSDMTEADDNTEESQPEKPELVQVEEGEKAESESAAVEEAENASDEVGPEQKQEVIEPIEPDGKAMQESVTVKTGEDTTAVEEKPAPKSAGKIEIDPSDFPRISQSGTGITQDLAKEISAIYEAEHQAQLKEKTVTVIQELPNVANEVVERMTEAVSQSETKTYTPVDMEEIKQPEDLSGATVVVPDLSIEAESAVQSTGVDGTPMDKTELPEDAVESTAPAGAEQSGVTGGFEKLPEETPGIQEQKTTAELQEKPVSDVGAELQLLRALEAELHEAESKIEETVAIAKPEIAAASEETMAVSATAQDVIAAVDEKVKGQDGGQTAMEETHQKEEAEPQQQASATGEVLPDKDLPTTRALHRSFADILILIGGEMDPSHFVLMGDGKERILGIAKKIAVVMRETGYLSSGRIAHIGAEQLNQMELSQFKKQLKGNCLLITNAAELLFPTITKVFSIMDEFYGDFTVILSDEGATLDQLFRFVPALARRFKYVIDISQYTEQDYK